MELGEVPRAKRRKSTESLGSGTSIDEVRAMIKTELNRALGNSIFDSDQGPSGQMKQLQLHQHEMRLADDKSIQDMRNTWTACQKAKQELQQHMTSWVNLPKQNTVHQQTITEYALRHLDSNAQTQNYDMDEMIYDQAQQTEYLRHLQHHPALASPVPTPTYGHPAITSPVPHSSLGDVPIASARINAAAPMEYSRDYTHGFDRLMSNEQEYFPPPGRANMFGDRRRNHGSEGNTRDFIPNVEIAPIPAFDALKFNQRRRGFLFWTQLRLFVPEMQIISPVCLNGGSILRSHAMRLFRTTELNPEMRTFGELLKVLGGQYAVSAQERDVEEMDKLSELRRENASQSRSSGPNSI